MLVQSPVAGDSRVLREATTLAEAGYQVHIVGRDVPDGFVAGPNVSVASVRRSNGIRPPSATMSPSTATGVRRRVARAGRWLLLPEHRDRTERAWRAEARILALQTGPFDVVHAHDFNTLELGVELARGWRVPLVYDSHELWFGRGLPGRPTPVARARGRKREARLGSRAQVVLTVSEGIADRLRGRDLRDVRVIRNTFELSGRPAPVVPETPTGIAYAGRVGAGRDLEAVVKAAASLAPLRVVLGGPRDESYHIDSTGVELVPAMSLEQVDQLYQELGIALVTLTDTCENHRLALPNKLFHAVRAGVPVVAADLPQLRAIVTAHHLGTLYRPGDSGSLADAVRSIVVHYADYVTAVRAAREPLSWEHDALDLLRAYGELAAR